jgi:DNA-directed RNA polymerase specialized sigma24 family protein
LSSSIPAPADRTDGLLAVDEAIARLEAAEPRKAQIVKLRFYAGLSVEEIAAVLDVSAITVKRDWRFARAWLGTCLSEPAVEHRRSAGPSRTTNRTVMNLREDD